MVAAERGVHDLRQLRVVQVAHGKVDGDGEVEPALPPLVALLDRRLDHPDPQGPDQAGVLGQVDELVGRDQTQPGVGPADQRLGAGHASRLDLDLGLVVQHQLVAVDGMTQLADQRQPRRRVAVGVGRVHAVARTGPLGHVHGDVRMTHQEVGVTAVLRIHRDPDRGADVDGLALDHEGRVQRVQQLAGDVGGGVGGFHAAEQECELVAAQPGHRVGAAQLAAQARGDVPQQDVAGLVAEGVVDLLEVVEVHHQQGQVVLLALGHPRAGRRRAPRVDWSSVNYKDALATIPKERPEGEHHPQGAHAAECGVHHHVGDGRGGEQGARHQERRGSTLGVHQDGADVLHHADEEGDLAVASADARERGLAPHQAPVLAQEADLGLQ